MGRKSTKDHKNMYQIYREAKELTREAAAEKIGFLSADQIEKIENEKRIPTPEDVLAMSKAYAAPVMCNQYCSNECAIGEKYVPEIEIKDLSVITLEMLSTLNTLTKNKDRLIDIAADGKITPDEIPDFIEIRDNLAKMSITVEALRLWVEQTIADGKLDKKLIEMLE